jgi:hypothetical protein
LTKGQKNESMAIQEKARGENLMVPTSVLRPSIAAAKDYCPFCGRKQTVASWLRYRGQSVFCVCGRRGVNDFSGGAVGINLNEALHMNKDSIPSAYSCYSSQELSICWSKRLTYYHQ